MSYPTIDTIEYTVKVTTPSGGTKLVICTEDETAAKRHVRILDAVSGWLQGMEVITLAEKRVSEKRLRGYVGGGSYYETVSVDPIEWDPRFEVEPQDELVS